MSHLSERADTVRVHLEGEWFKHYLRNKSKHWRSTSLVKNLKRERLCETEFEAWQVLAELAAAGVVEAPVTSLKHHVSLTLGLSEAVCHRLESEATPVDPSLKLDASQAVVWRHALAEGLEDWSLADQYQLAEGLRALAADIPGAYAWSAFEASARYLLGSSKLLMALPRELVRSFGIDTTAFRGPLAWVLASVPDEPQGVLLIENPQSFDQACRVGLDEHLALVCSFGYGLSLTEVLKAPEQVRLIGGRASSHTLSELLELPAIMFWGDLDPEGLRIFLRLRQSVPRIRLSALYAPMMERLETEGGHPLHILTGKAGQRQASRWSRGLDQEALDDAALGEWGGETLDESRAERWLALLSEADEEGH